MLVKDIIENLLLAVGGITVFLYGLKLMSGGVNTLAGDKMQGLIKKATRSPVIGASTGAIVTAVIQSSTATNVMLVGFVNAGVMGLSAAIPVIMGANIGTTVTAQLVSLSGSSLFNVTAVGSLIGFAGLLISVTKWRWAKIGEVMLGFSLVFIGLEIMNSSVAEFKDYELFLRLFTVKNSFLLLLNGFLITAIVQSSSAVSSVMIILALNGVIGFEESAYLILGTNIGSGVAVLLVSSAMTKEARLVAISNLAFNLVGTIVVLPFLLVFEGQISDFFASVSGGIERQIANFHTVFNLLTTVLLLPFTCQFERAVVFLCSKGIVKKSCKRRQARRAQ